MPSEPKEVVIVGGGFAGLRCAVGVAPREDLHITLIDKDNYQQFQPLLYQVAASLISTDNAAFALRDVLRNHANVEVQMGSAVSVDLNSRTVKTAAGESYKGDFLVLATGSQANFFGVPGADQYTFPLYSLNDAEKLRSVVLRAFEEVDDNPEKAKEGLNFVIVGGGPTGVEMAGALSEMTEWLLSKEFRHLAGISTKVFLVERGHSVLGAFTPKSQEYAASTLTRRGVQVNLGVAVEEVTPDAVVLSGGVTIPSRMVIWAAGLKAVTVPCQPDLPSASGGRIAVCPDFSVPGFPGVYAIGDVAHLAGVDGAPLPQLASVAVQAGRHCARNILAILDGETAVPFKYLDKGILAMIGRNAAIAELGKSRHEVVGPMAYATWLGVHAALITAPRAKLEAIAEWAWEYFAHDHLSQLIDR